jgi:hypothetical protein
MPQYKGWDPDEAVKDYWKRIKDHELTYETIEQPSFPYVKIINVGERIVVNNIQGQCSTSLDQVRLKKFSTIGYLQSRIVFFLMNVHNVGVLSPPPSKPNASSETENNMAGKGEACRLSSMRPD